MDVRQLRYLLTVVDHQGFNRAAFVPDEVVHAAAEIQTPCRHTANHNEAEHLTNSGAQPAASLKSGVAGRVAFRSVHNGAHAPARSRISVGSSDA